MAFIQPEEILPEKFSDPQAAYEQVCKIYDRNTAFIRTHLAELCEGNIPDGHVRACYPKASFTLTSHAKVDSRLAYGFIHTPGVHETTLTHPELYQAYLLEQFTLLLNNHGGEIVISESDMPIPLHFAVLRDTTIDGKVISNLGIPLRDIFDVPDLAVTDDEIANGTHESPSGGPFPLAPFTAPRIDYSLHRLAHYSATEPEHFQKFVLFTNYQFYIEEFCRFAKEMMDDDDCRYHSFVEPGNVITPHCKSGMEPSGTPVDRVPQMSAYHLKAKDNLGITMVNIGVGPSNAKTITDHIAVLRPHAWIMLGHCGGLRNSQSLGDYVLAHAYVREDHVLDADLPLSVPVPALAEIQVALEEAVAEVTSLKGFDAKKIMRTGTVVTIDNRNWELRDHREPALRFSQSRAIAMDMESATIAANGFRFRVPYGTLLCVSDKPLHGELKLPGMASDFYRTQVDQHLKIGLAAIDILRNQPVERLHSRKLRSFSETAFQ